jgi:hypothetical protein
MCTVQYCKKSYIAPLKNCAGKDLFGNFDFDSSLLGMYSESEEGGKEECH